MANASTTTGSTQPSVQVGDGVTSLRGGDGGDLLIAEPQVFTAPLSAVNGSGVSGTVQVSVTGDGQMRVQIDATGLEANQPHEMHIHGLDTANGTPLDSVPPTASLDTDHDGFIEMAEAQRAAGPVLLTLSPTSTAPDGTIHYDQTFSLSDPQGLASGATVAELFPLDFRSVEIHGLSTAPGAGAGTGGEVDGTAGFKPTLPVATADLHVQTPATTATTTTTTTGSDGIFLSGGNGDDRLIGGHFDDVLVGGNGNDVLDGGPGNDILVGGSGADRFLVGQGRDVINDFNAAAGDRLAFAHNGQSTLVLHDTNQGTWVIEGTGDVSDPNSQGVLLQSVHIHAATDPSHWFA